MILLSANCRTQILRMCPGRAVQNHHLFHTGLIPGLKSSFTTFQKGFLHSQRPFSLVKKGSGLGREEASANKSPFDSRKPALVGNWSGSLCLEYFEASRIICNDKIHTSRPSNKDEPRRILMVSLLLERERKSGLVIPLWME